MSHESLNLKLTRNYDIDMIDNNQLSARQLTRESSRQSGLRTSKTTIFVTEQFDDLDEQTINQFSKKTQISLKSLRAPPSLQITQLTNCSYDVAPKPMEPQSSNSSEEPQVYPKMQLEQNIMQKQVNLADLPNNHLVNLIPLIQVPNTKPSVYQKYMPDQLQFDELFSYGRLGLIGARNSLARDIVTTIANQHNQYIINVTLKELLSQLKVYKTFQKTINNIFELADFIKPCLLCFHDFDLMLQNEDCHEIIKQILVKQASLNSFSASPIYMVFLTQQLEQINIEVFRKPIYVGFLDLEDRIKIIEKVAGSQIEKYKYLATELPYLSIAQFRSSIKKVLEGQQPEPMNFTEDDEKRLQWSINRWQYK
ncbi:P-loop_containing nucleoside triphosphate hydrolase [Hexamita inflata]|uniref:P-loop containing nucleoside triphosphate hydrolase n=1 Tax=Hexamita inflata TaxID=28002 RepID=A0AA86P3L9_9EUKA|nr:P-loop containing nucleoside triphosphate hydrolase [Hexamita inflata]